MKKLFQLLYRKCQFLFSRVEKRRRFLIASGFLTLLVFISSLIPFELLWIYVILLIPSVYFFTFFSILDGIDGVEWFFLFIIPVLFTFASVMFYVLIPVRWLSRLSFISLYGISIYAILLGQNIFNVGVEKNLQLYRAAFSVNFLFTTIISYLLANYMLSFRFDPFINAVFLFIIVFPLALHIFWSINPKVYIRKRFIAYALYVAFWVAEIIYVFSFIPIRTQLRSLLSSSSYYAFVGLVHLFIERKIITNRVREYVMVIVFVSVLVLLSARW